MTKWIIKYHQNKNKTEVLTAYGDINAEAFKKVASIKGWKIISITPA